MNAKPADWITPSPTKHEQDRGHSTIERWRREQPVWEVVDKEARDPVLDAMRVALA